MKYILLGDTHFGVKKFSLDFLENQMRFFDNQLFPYMIDNDIDTIIQVGDVFDNRSSMDINFMHQIRERFFDKLKANNFKLITLLGNHDIYFKNTRAVNMVNIFRELYDNIIVYNDQQVITINNTSVGVVPFLLPGEAIDANILSCKYILGHFETQGFEISKGIVDTHSQLTTNTFSSCGVQTVFSGHYHIKDTKGIVKYIGTPYNTTWNDYGNMCGFHVLHEDFSISFIENVESVRFVKMVYNKDFYIDGVKYDEASLKTWLGNNKYVDIKFYVVDVDINNTDHERYSLILSDASANYSIIDNRIDPNDAVSPTDIFKITTTDKFLHEYIQTHHSDLYSVFLELIDSE